MRLVLDTNVVVSGFPQSFCCHALFTVALREQQAEAAKLNAAIAASLKELGYGG